MRHALTLCTLSLLLAPLAAEAALKAGDAVVLKGRQHRQCAATIQELPSPGFARVSFDSPLCGDASQPYEVRRLQPFETVKRFRGLAVGDAVTFRGHFARDCSGTVGAITRAGLVQVRPDSRFCADAEGLLPAASLRKAEYVPELEQDGRKLELGAGVRAKGIHEGDLCRGQIDRLTSSGLARIRFLEPTCADGGHLYPVRELEPDAAKPARARVSGRMIFEHVMREIASAKKVRRQARR